MTTVPVSQSLLPTLGRMALGLLLSAAGLSAAWLGSGRALTPGMSVLDTALNIPLDGPLPLDLARSAALSFTGDRVDVTAAPLPAQSAQIVQGRAHHRARNPIQAEVTRQGRAMTAHLTLWVPPISSRGVILSGPEPVQHSVNLALNPTLPLSVSSLTSSGAQRLNLAGLRLRELTVRTDSGAAALTLPGRPSGPLSVVTHSGAVSLSAPRGSAPEALRVNTTSGSQALNLSGLSTPTLGLGSDSGAVRVTLPLTTGHGTVTTGSGDITLTATPQTRGNLDIRTHSGHVTLRLPATLSVRVRFTDRDAITLPPGQPPDPAPALDIFVDAGRTLLTITTLEDTP